MPNKNAVQLLQEIVNKLAGDIVTNLSNLTAINDSTLASTASLADAAALVAVTADLLSQQLDTMLPARSGNLYSIAAVAATNANPDLVLLWPSPKRKGATIYNDSAAILYLLAGQGTATSTNFTLQVPPNGYYEVPFTFSGTVRGVWSSATGSARVTEYTL